MSDHRAERLGVSRQAVYDWKRRCAEDPVMGLNARSRRPHTSPTRTDEAVEERVIVVGDRGWEKSERRRN
jgi:transposase